MPPFHTTLMGVVQGALEYHGIEVSAPTLFGASGHAFLINIAKDLCPSGPYVWNRDRAAPLIRNLGLEMADLGFFSPHSSPQDRAAVEGQVRDALDQGVPCSLLNMENQLIAGYDDEGFLLLQPWGPSVPITPARLTYGSWREFGDTFHVSFFSLAHGQPAQPLQAVLDSLDYAVALHLHPENHSFEGYGIGPNAYANWIGAAPEFGASHGNWWNAMVWSECRRMASGYMAEIQNRYGDLAGPAAELAGLYSDIAGALGRVGDKEMAAQDKIDLLAETKEKEAAAIGKVAALAASLLSGPLG